MIHCGDGDEAGIPKPIGEGDEIQFNMGRVTGKYM